MESLTARPQLQLFPAALLRVASPLSQPQNGHASSGQPTDAYVPGLADPDQQRDAQLRAWATRSKGVVANANGSGAIQAAPAPRTESASTSSPLFADNSRYLALQQAVEQLQQLEKGRHPGLAAEHKKIDEQLQKEVQNLDQMRQLRKDSISAERARLDDLSRLAHRRSMDDYAVEKKERTAQHNKAVASHEALRKGGHGQIADTMNAIDEIDVSLARDGVTAESRQKLEALRAANVRRLKERSGISYPDGAKLEQLKKRGAPEDSSPQGLVDRTIFHRSQRRAMDTLIPKNADEQKARDQKTRAEISAQREELTKQSLAVEPTYNRHHQQYRHKAEAGKSSAVRSLREKLEAQQRENSTFKVSELSEQVRNTPAMANLAEAAEARLVNGKLSFIDKNGRQVKVSSFAESVTVSTTDRTDFKGSGSEHTSWLSPAAASHRKTEYGSDGQVTKDETSELDRDGNGTHKSRQKIDDLNTDLNFYEKAERTITERLKGGKVTARDTMVLGENGRVRKSTRATFEYGADGLVTESRVHDDTLTGKKTHSTSRVDKDGNLVSQSTVEAEKVEGGEKTTTTTFDSADKVKRATEHQVVVKPGHTIESTIKTEDGKTVSMSEESTSTPRAATKDEKDLPGLGWVPWKNPQDLMKRMEESGTVQIQTVERKISGPDGKVQTEKATKYIAYGHELVHTKGPDGKNIWTERKRTAGGKWDSQVFFQGSSQDTIITRHSKSPDGRFEIEKTELSMKDHPGSSTGQVPVKGDYEVHKTSAGRVDDIAQLAQRLGMSEKELAESGSYKAFTSLYGEHLKKNPHAKLSLELKTARDTFSEPHNEKNADGGSLVVSGPDGLRLVLNQDKKNDRGGARLEWTDNGQPKNHETAFVGGHRFELVQGRDELPKGLRDLLSGAYEKPVQTGPAPAPGLGHIRTTGGALTHINQKNMDKAFRWAGGKGAAPIVDARLTRGLGVVSSGLTATTAMVDLANGNYEAALKNGSKALLDLGKTAKAFEKATGRSARGLGGAGATGVLKKMGLAGAAVGLVSGAGRMLDGDAVGGGLDMGGALAAGMALYGIPGVGWIAGLATAGSLVWDYRNDTVIAPPRL